MTTFYFCLIIKHINKALFIVIPSYNAGKNSFHCSNLLFADVSKSHLFSYQWLFIFTAGFLHFSHVNTQCISSLCLLPSHLSDRGARQWVQTAAPAPPGPSREGGADCWAGFNLSKGRRWRLDRRVSWWALRADLWSQLNIKSPREQIKGCFFHQHEGGEIQKMWFQQSQSLNGGVCCSDRQKNELYAPEDVRKLMALMWC